MKIKTKLTLAFLLICLVPLITITIYISIVTNKTITRQVLNHLESVASIQHARTHAVIDKDLERLSLISSNTQLRINLDNYIKEKNRSDQEEMNRSLLDSCSAITGFQNIDILNLDGEVIASTNEAKIGTSHVHEECFVRGLEENSVDMLFLDENRNLKVHFSGPIYLEDKLLGVVVIEATTRSIISIVKDYSGLGETGETLLAKRDENGDALFITPLRFDADAVLTKRVSKEALELPITQALLGNEQLFTDSIDYRGEPVLAATRYIENTDWGLVVKIDKAEAFAPAAGVRNLLVLIIVIVSIVVFFVSIYLARNITRPIARLTRTATEISGGNLSRRIEVTSKDEIGVLAQSFNQMTENLAEAYAGLEQKVKQRTAELEKEVAERKRAEEKIKASLKEKELLLQEIHHRVKNNLQVISSLLKLQSEYIEDKQAFQMFKDSQNRIKSMALIHEKLYKSKDLAEIDFKIYINDLAYELFRSYEIDPSKIALRMDVKDISLRIDVAIPCGLIINELISNSLKYAFPQGREGGIKIALRSINKNKIELKVKDNGIGLPEDFDFRKTKSLGLHIVTILVEDQLDGKIELNRAGGTEFKITFKRGK